MQNLVLNLRQPGMTLLHRAGLGGLASTLRAIERSYRRGRIRDDFIPGLVGGRFPWTIGRHAIELQFGSAEPASFLTRLFAFAFAIKQSVIDLPGTYREELSFAVRAELQLGMTLTFLQHGRVRALAPLPSVHTFEVAEQPGSQVQVEFRRCLSFKHQAGAEDLTLKGKLRTNPVEVIGPLNPGAVVRHNAFPSETKIEESVDRILPLYFAMVGSLSLPVNRGCGVLIVPDVTDLIAFADARPRMTPTSARECRIGGAGDAALQMALRLKNHRWLGRTGFAGVYAVLMRPTAWASQQKSRVQVIQLRPFDDERDPRLRQFDIAMRHLPPKIRSKEVTERLGKGKQSSSVRKTEWFWVDSILRPHIAENLARPGRRWYDNFIRLSRDRDDSGNKLSEKLRFEERGLQAMAHEQELTSDDEYAFIKSLHRAIFNTLGKIKVDAMGVGSRGKKPTQMVFNRWDRFKEGIRLDLTGAKTAAQSRFALNKILARVGTVKELTEEAALRQVQQLVFHRDWERTRDLALFALASYKRPRDADPIVGDPTEETTAN